MEFCHRQVVENPPILQSVFFHAPAPAAGVYTRRQPAIPTQVRSFKTREKITCEVSLEHRGSVTCAAALREACRRILRTSPSPQCHRQVGLC
ncbi:MAG: hypothetical protein LBG43_05395 [Treponema sp.]|nr:hypothetical protein [Treponema sp.]